MARFRCCGSATTEGHANDCSLKPPEATFEAREPEVKDEEGCRFDILQFRHIGECRGTCGGKEEGIRFADESGGELKILILMVDELSEEDIRELEKRGLKHLDDDAIEKILDMAEAGEIEVSVMVMTLEEIREQYAEQPKEDPNPFLTIKEAAEALQFSEGWTRTLCRDGRFEGAIKLDRRWAVPHDAIFEKED